jgi:uncharacterized protein (DUF58 family)
MNVLVKRKLPPPPKAKHPRYLRVQDVRALRHLLFTTRRPVAGLYAGRHASPQRGRSVEFNDYREYSLGDPPGDIDWKVFGRTDRLMVKIFEHQSDMAVSLLVDGSSSMAYRGLPAESSRLSSAPASAPPSKYDQACLLAAAIGFLTVKQQDRISFGVACDGLRSFLPSHCSHLHLRTVLAAMERHMPKANKPARLGEAITEFAQRVARKGLVIVFSDLMEEMDEVLRALTIFTHRGNDAIVFHVLHPDELNLPATEETLFVDSETGAELRLDVAAARSLYEQRLRSYLDAWQAAFRQRGIDYKLVRTDEPFQKALEGYLLRRAAVMR